jgi:hypothetical protein
MSPAVISTSAAQGRFFILDAEVAPEVSPVTCGRNGDNTLRESARIHPQSTSKNQQSTILSSVVPASHLSIRPAPEMVSTGIAALDSLIGGLPRGCLTEISGPASSGRTTILLAALAAATQRREFCAIVDAGDALDPQSAAAAEIELDRLLWVRCTENSPNRRNTEKIKYKNPQSRSNRSAERSLEQLLRVTDLLLESGGFGLIALDLCDLPLQTARRIPLTTWFRFRRAVEHTHTVLLVIERQSIAGSCSSLLIKLKSMKPLQEGAPLLAGFARSGNSNHFANSQSMLPHAQLLTKLEISAELVHSRLERKPVRPTEITFAGKPAWAG